VKAAFFLIGDTHYLADKADPSRLTEVSRDYTSRLIGRLNELPGTMITPEAGGGIVATPRGVIHAGDLIDTGDKNGAPFEAMKQTELDAFIGDFGLDGGDGRLLWPIREVYGNHDAPRGEGVVLERLRERNTRRAGTAAVSANGVHFSWDWGGVHFVNLGIVVGEAKTARHPRRYAPLDSLDFLVADLADNVGDSGRPVVITHHIDVARYCAPPPADSAGNFKNEWDYADMQAYHAALKGYRIAGIFYGHTHNRRIFPWDGTPPKAAEPAAGGSPSSTRQKPRISRARTRRSCISKSPIRTLWPVNSRLRTAGKRGSGRRNRGHSRFLPDPRRWRSRRFD
jgi:predicted phosphodiesterase